MNVLHLYNGINTPLKLRGQKLAKLDFPVPRLRSLTVCRSLLKLWWSSGMP